MDAEAAAESEGEEVKFRMSLKDAAGFSSAVIAAAERSVAAMNLDDLERESLVESRSNKYSMILSRWFKDLESVTIEFDLEKGTATVVERKR